MAYLTTTELRAYLGIETSTTFTADAATDLLTLASVPFAAESIKTGTPVTLTTTAADLPAPLAIDTVYYVHTIVDQTCALATSSALATAGTAINITDAGTGTHTITLALNDDDLLEEAIDDAVSYIESQTNRIFDASTESIRYYGRDALSDDDTQLLLVDADLVTANTVTNGDGQSSTTYTASAGTDRLTLASATLYGELATATSVTVSSTAHVPPPPLVEGTVYYVILVASPDIQLAATALDAVAGTQVNLTGVGAGTHTIVVEGTLISNTEYWLHPRNLGPPYHGIRLKTDSASYWTFDTDYFVSVNGFWGYSLTPPGDIKRAATVLAAFFYKSKDSQVFDVTAIPEAGVITIPQGIPATVTRVIERYKRYI